MTGPDDQTREEPPFGVPELEVQRIVDVAQNGQIGAPAAES